MPKPAAKKPARPARAAAREADDEALVLNDDGGGAEDIDALDIQIDPVDNTHLSPEEIAEAERKRAKEKPAVADDDAAAEEEEDDSPEETVAGLKERLAAEKRRADKAEAIAKKSNTQVAESRKNARQNGEREIENQRQTLKSSLEAAKAEEDLLERQRDEAFDSGDKEKYRELDRKLRAAGYKVSSIQDRQGVFEDWVEKEWKPKQDAADKGEVSTGGDSGEELTPETQEWIEGHPEFNKEGPYRRMALSLHHAAVAEGYEMDSADYFDYIDSGLTKRFGNKHGQPGHSKPVTATPRVQPKNSGGAPVRASGGGGFVPVSRAFPHVPKGFAVPKDWQNAAHDQGFVEDELAKIKAGKSNLTEEQATKKGILAYCNMRLEPAKKEEGA